MKQKKIQDRLNRHFLKALTRKRICCHPECKNFAINSHILQKNGILSGIATNGHIYVLRSDFLNPDIFYFKKSGLNITYAFKGFCMEHDKSIFKPIEDYEINFEDYGSQLLFAYRTILNERRKKEILIDWKYIQLDDSFLNQYMDSSITKFLIEQERLSLNDLRHYEELILSDLYSKTENFTFKTRTTSRIEICLASHFTFETTRQRSERIEATGADIELLTDISISFFPLEDESVLIMGYSKEMEEICGDFVASFFSSDEDTLLKLVSNVIINRCEEWACSEAFYFEKIEPRKDKIIELTIEGAASIDENKEIDFNLFELK